MGLVTRLMRRQVIVLIYGDEALTNVESIEICSPYGVIVKFMNGEVWKFARNEAEAINERTV